MCVVNSATRVVNSVIRAANNVIEVVNNASHSAAARDQELHERVERHRFRVRAVNNVICVVNCVIGVVNSSDQRDPCGKTKSRPP